MHPIGMMRIRKEVIFLDNDRFRKLILMNFLSVSDFAKAVGISRNSVYDILAGRYYPRVNHYLKMCELLNVDPWTLRLYLPGDE